MKHLFYIILISLFCLNITAFAQNPEWINYTNGDLINAIETEDDGLLSPDSILLNETSLEEDSIGTVIKVLSLPQGESPEGIAVDYRGNIFISNTKGVDKSINEILQLEQNGSYTVYATLPGKGHVRGLVTDLLGNVYVAFATEDTNTTGVYQIDNDGTPDRLTGSEQIGSPNALAFDALGNLYVTDSYKGKNFEGSVWCYNKKEQVFKLFIKDPLLDGGVPPNGPPFPLPGANGITFYPPNKLYVANTRQSSVVLIAIDEFGNEPTIVLVKKDSLLMNIDGIVVDNHENIYGVLPSSTLSALGAPLVPPLVKLDTKSGVISPVINDNSNFDTPTSLAFRKTANGVSLFITNAALQYGQPPMAGPGVVKVRLEAISIKDK